MNPLLASPSNLPDESGPVLRPALMLFVLLSVVTGLLYPLLLTGAAQLAFPHQANGSLIRRDGVVVGSELIGQAFSEPGYFWGRLSATGSLPYNGAASGGSNFGPAHPALAEAVQRRLAALREADPGNRAPVPVDLVTASASGLDPHISPAAAMYQVARVARARGVAPGQLIPLLDKHTMAPWLGVMGEARVNVLTLNLALDAMRRP